MTKFDLYLQLPMEDGQIGLAYKDGAKPMLKDDILVPGNDWKKPEWKEDVITKEQAIELVALAEEKRVSFCGTISKALKVEKAFEEEEKWLKDGMDVLKIGRAASNIWRAEE